MLGVKKKGGGIYTKHMVISLSRLTETAVACSSVCKPIFEGNMILQILRHHQRAQDNQYEHSYIYIKTS